ncbi:MAG: methyltransferase domain-containing protein [Verrucomicrobia bacterium]|nr:methyltransferase domain-containing protein [Verrucomicrobiota bacterium]
MKGEHKNSYDRRQMLRRLRRLTEGYRTAQTLFAAARLGIFDALGRGRMTATELARRLDADPRATRMLCDALAALGLLVKERDRYGCAPLARETLLRNSPQSQLPLVLHNAELYERWAALDRTVRTGAPPAREGRRDAGAFAQAMASAAVEAAEETAAVLDLAGARRAMDLGGGPGVYAIQMARRWKRLQVVVTDFPEALKTTRRIVKAAGLSDRIHCRPADVLKDPLGGGYDFILISNVIHSFGPEENRLVLRRAAEALAPGGRIAVKDFLLSRSRTRPAQAALFALNMLVNTPAGDCYTAEEVKAWLQEAGLQFAGRARLSPPSSIVFGVKPAGPRRAGGGRAKRP